MKKNAKLRNISVRRNRIFLERKSSSICQPTKWKGIVDIRVSTINIDCLRVV